MGAEELRWALPAHPSSSAFPMQILATGRTVAAAAAAGPGPGKEWVERHKSIPSDIYNSMTDARDTSCDDGAAAAAAAPPTLT